MKEHSHEQEADEYLMEQVRQGKVTYLGTLFQRYVNKIYDYFYRMTRDSSLSDDLVQTVFEKALRGKHTYRESYPFAGWIFRIARNVLMDHFRAGKGRYQEELEAHHAITELSVSHLDQSDIERALDRLSPEYREVLLLTRYEDLKYSEVAKITGISETGIKSRVFRALKQLKVVYENIVDHE